MSAIRHIKKDERIYSTEKCDTMDLRVIIRQIVREEARLILVAQRRGLSNAIAEIEADVDLKSES